MDTRFGCNTLYPYGRLTDVRAQFGLQAQKDALQIIKGAGFDACEFSHYEYLDVAECEALRLECARLGLAPWSAHSWVVIPEDAGEAEQRLKAQRISLEGAAALGAEVMVVHASSGKLDIAVPEQRRARKTALEMTLLGLEPFCVALGVRLAIENCSTRADLEFLIETVDELGLPDVGFNIDTGHAALRGMTPQDAIQLMGKRLITTHLQDNFGERDDHLPPGLGSIDFVAVVAALRQVNYGGVYMIEISDCPPGREPDSIADTRTAYENLSAFCSATA